jgi:hypothetical protein
MLLCCYQYDPCASYGLRRMTRTLLEQKNIANFMLGSLCFVDTRAYIPSMFSIQHHLLLLATNVRDILSSEVHLLLMLLCI